KAENNFIFKSLMLHYTFWTIQYTYGFLSSINQPFSPFLAKYYFILKKIYLWRCSQSNNKGSKYFHNSYQFRFKEQVTHMEFKKILMKSIFGIQQAKYQKQYYVFIENHIILAKGNNSLSLYNPANERILYLENIKSKTLINALGKNSFHCSMKELLKPSTFSFIQKLYQNRMGGLVTIPEPLAQVKFQNNSAVGKIYFENKFLIQGHNSFMPILTFYINDKCNQECSVCQLAFRQHIYCTCKNSSVELHLEAIKKTINDFLLFAIPTINIIGGNLMLYKELNELHSFLQKSGLVVNYYINYQNINNSDILSKLGSGKSVIHFLVNLSDHRYKRLESLHSLHIDNVRLRFLIQKKEDIKAVNNLCKNIDDEKVDLEPFFSGKNKLFFKKCVFLSKKEILKSIDAGHVQLRSIVNTENIGKLFILPNGEIKTNMKENSLGNIYINSLTDLLNSNAIEESSWFRIRKSVEPCYRCINNPFCPSISDFEYETGHKICKDVKIPSL
ncbi:MAG: hypothetical protein Q8T08_12155, partial [Ignavibacteria bacterium]|nr:hypothetical protein [Ignavibacteria bacterium]